jgi:hypothetical protein
MNFMHFPHPLCPQHKKVSKEMPNKAETAGMVNWSILTTGTCCLPTGNRQPRSAILMSFL